MVPSFSIKMNADRRSNRDEANRFLRGFSILIAGIWLLGVSADPTSAQETTVPTATTTTVVQVWSAQVVRTEDLGKVASASTQSTVEATTTFVSTSTLKPSAKKKKSSTRVTPSSTLVRILPPTPTATTIIAVTPTLASAAVPTSTAKAGRRTQSTTTSTTALASQSAAPAVAKPVGTNDQFESALLKLRQCESGNRYALNTGNGYYGAYQFALSTWKRLGYGGYPHEAAPPMQDEAARKLQAKSGWGQWPACARKLGLI